MMRAIAFAVILALALVAYWAPEHRAPNAGLPVIHAARQQKAAADARKAAEKRASAALTASERLTASARSGERQAKPCEPSKVLEGAWR
jgi:hypothetical protein